MLHGNGHVGLLKHRTYLNILNSQNKEFKSPQKGTEVKCLSAKMHI